MSFNAAIRIDMLPYTVQGKIAIVTGAGSGIGHALTESLLSAGCSVVLADLKLRPEAKSMVDRYQHPPAEVDLASAVFLPTDVTNWKHLQALWDESLRLHKQIDIVVSVAGIYEPPWSSFWKPPGISAISRDCADAETGQYATIAVNLVGPIRLAQLAIDHWTQRQIRGNYLAMASISAYLHSIETPLYMASKAALVSFVRSLKDLHGLCNIRMAALCPGSVLTPMFEPEWNRKLTADDIALTPEECANVTMRVLQEPQWGNGSIVEAQKVGTKEAPLILIRDVELEILYPLPAGRPNQRVVESRQRMMAEVQEKGMRS